MFKRKVFIATAIFLLAVQLTGCKTVSTTENGVVKKVDKQAAANANVNLGIAYLEKKDMQKAKEKLLLAQKLSPKDPAAWYGMGYYYDVTGNLAAAKKSYLKAVSLAPKDGASQNNYGTFLCRHKKYDEAIQRFLLAASNKDYLETAEAYENAGLCALQIPDTQLAIKFFQTALQQDPTLTKSLLEMAELKFKAKDYQVARRYLKRFQFYGKPNPQSSQLEARLNKVLKGSSLDAAKRSQG